MKIACVLITHLRAKVELRRHLHLRERAVVIVDRSRGRPMVIDHFTAASHVAAGMTLEQALSRQGDGAVLEADEAAYRRALRRMLIRHTQKQQKTALLVGAQSGCQHVKSQ